MKIHIYFITIFSLLISCKEKIGKENITEVEKKLIENKSGYVSLGLQYAMNTQKVLGKNLTNIIKSKGLIEAVKYCNINAYPLTDSMSVAQNVVIKRISDKNRNIENKATDKERSYINNFKKAVLQNKTLQPIIVESNTDVSFYLPIITVPKCLQCHGVIGKEIKPNVYKTIQKLYPEDKAIGYNVNEVRGLWRVVFSKN